MFNIYFHTADNVVYKRVANNEVITNDGGFITNIGGVVKTFMNGQEVPVPEVLYNEVGTAYRYVENFYKLGAKLAKKNGVYKAKKAKGALIRVFTVRSKAQIDSVINGFKEADLMIPEDGFLVQNVVGGEYYTQTREYLEQNYTLVRHEGIYDVYESKGNEQSWVYCDFNIFGALWDGIEFLTTPMINITNPNDCYGCNYIRWWGDDGTPGTYLVVGFFRACGTKFYPQPFAVPVGVQEAGFNPPKELLEQEVA